MTDPTPILTAEQVDYFRYGRDDGAAGATVATLATSHEALRAELVTVRQALTDLLDADRADGPHDQHGVSEIGNDRCVYCGNIWPCPNARAHAVLLTLHT